jgi:hypothetical protein
MADQAVPTLIVGALVLLALIGMVVGWRARRRRQSDLDAVLPVPDQLSPSRLEREVLYVATTLAEAPLERVAVGGLGVRGKATVSVHAEGVVLAIRGAAPAWLPAEHLTSAGLGTFAIDRVVERDGLVVITWQLADRSVDSYLRAATASDKTALVDAVNGIARGQLT